MMKSDDRDTSPGRGKSEAGQDTQKKLKLKAQRLNESQHSPPVESKQETQLVNEAQLMHESPQSPPVESKKEAQLTNSKLSSSPVEKQKALPVDKNEHYEHCKYYINYLSRLAYYHDLY